MGIADGGYEMGEEMGFCVFLIPKIQKNCDDSSLGLIADMKP